MTRKFLGYALLITSLLTIIVWVVRQFVYPILPNLINNSLLIFVAAILGVAGFLATFKDIVELFKVLNSYSDVMGIDKDSVVITHPAPWIFHSLQNVAELKYLGDEPARDFQVCILWKDTQGKIQQQKVESFSRESNPISNKDCISPSVLEPNETLYFRLLANEAKEETKMTIVVKIKGVKSKRRIEYKSLSVN